MFSWSPDSRYVYFRWHQAGVDTRETVYRVRPDGGQIERLAGADPDTILAAGPCGLRTKVEPFMYPATLPPVPAGGRYCLSVCLSCRPLALVQESAGE